MTHELHCIVRADPFLRHTSHCCHLTNFQLQFMLGRIFNALAADGGTCLPDDYQTHVFHCLDYMRQAAMCSADVSLEAHTPNDGSDNGPTDGGWSGQHVCKDYGEVVQYLEGKQLHLTRTALILCSC